MITRLMWTIWTSLSAVRERPLNLITHSLTPPTYIVVCALDPQYFHEFLILLNGYFRYRLASIEMDLVLSDFLLDNKIANKFCMIPRNWPAADRQNSLTCFMKNEIRSGGIKYNLSLDKQIWSLKSSTIIKFLHYYIIIIRIIICGHLKSMFYCSLLVTHKIHSLKCSLVWKK